VKLPAAFIPKPRREVSEAAVEKWLKAPAQAAIGSLCGFCLPIAGTVPGCL